MSNNHENLINSAAKHLGTSPDAIKSAVQSGSVDNLISSMPPEEAEKLKKFLSNNFLKQGKVIFILMILKSKNF